MSLKLLYLSCHEILEFDEISLLSELEYEVFSPGAYVEPKNPGGNSLRPGLDITYDPNVLEQFHRIGAAHPGKDGKNHLTKEFVDNFDIVLVMHMPRWIQLNWEVMKHKRVIWRTIGQSIASTEHVLSEYRQQGMEIVRYSPKEEDIPGFIGMDAIIRFYKDPADYGGWTGEKERVITFAQSMKQRDMSCNYTLFEQVTRPFNRCLFGPGNDQEDWMAGKVSFEQLKEEMRSNRAYFYTGTHPASYTLNFMESWMTGIPVVAIGPKYGNAAYFPGHDLYEVPDLITNEATGFLSDNPKELEDYVRQLLSNPSLARKIGKAGREEAIRHFGKDMIRASWKEYLDE